jgi:hypothetical protein
VESSEADSWKVIGTCGKTRRYQKLPEAERAISAIQQFLFERSAIRALCDA